MDKKLLLGKTNIIIQYLVGLTFVVIIYLPLIQQKMNYFRYIILDENREKIQLPKFNFSDLKSGNYFTEYEKYYNDNFGFRDLLVNLHSKILFNIFRNSPSEKVIIGKERWLFYADTIKDYQRQSLSEQDIGTIANNIEKVFENLDNQGISTYLLIAPNSNTIYPEFMPDGIERTINGKSNLDHLVGIFDQKVKDKYLDLRKILFENKQKGLLYFKNDTHWNTYGNVIVMNFLLDNIYRNYNIPYSQMEIESGSLEYDAKYKGDLLYLIGLENKQEYAAPIIVNSNNEKLPTTFIYHDSFFDRILKYIKPYFQELYSYNLNSNTLSLNNSIQKYIDKDIKIVVIEITERNISLLLDHTY